MKAYIGGFQGISNVDWPGKVCSVVFFAGCNLRCRYCYNKLILTKKNRFLTDLDEIKEQIKDNLPLLDAVMFSGGEPFLQPEALLELITWAKKKELEVGVETNGTTPDLIKKFISKLDFVAIDIKTPLEHEFYKRATKKSKIIELIKKSVEIIKNSGIKHEFRTTLVPGLIDKIGDIEKIHTLIKENYVLQKFHYNIGNVVDKRFDGKDFSQKYIKDLTTWAKGKKIKMRFWT